MGLVDWLSGDSTTNPQRGRDQLFRIKELLESQLKAVRVADDAISDEGIVAAHDTLYDERSYIEDFFDAANVKTGEYDRLREHVKTVKTQIGDHRADDAVASLDELISRLESLLQKSIEEKDNVVS